MNAIKRIGKISVGLITLLIATNSYAPNVTLAWDEHSDPSVTGYKIWWGVSSRTYTNNINVPGKEITSVTVSNLSLYTTYYFAATAYTTNLESDYSIEVSYNVPSSIKVKFPARIYLK